MTLTASFGPLYPAPPEMPAQGPQLWSPRIPSPSSRTGTPRLTQSREGSGRPPAAGWHPTWVGLQVLDGPGQHFCHSLAGDIHLL